MKVRETTAAALLDPQISGQHLVAYLPAVDCLAIAASTITALADQVVWLPVGDVEERWADGRLMVVVELDGHVHEVAGGYPIVIGEAES